MPSTLFSTSESLVLQIGPNEIAGEIEVNGIRQRRTSAHIFLPNITLGSTISCPLNYFQTSCSISQRWILNDQMQRIILNAIDNLRNVVITKKVNEQEEVINISENLQNRLFEYFAMDIDRNLQDYAGFDCYAFVSLLGNVKYFPPSPAWAYSEVESRVGDFIVLASGANLPDAIEHWALNLGDDFYLSKFGRSGEGADAHVAVMNLAGMQRLYLAEFIYSAQTAVQHGSWDGYNYN